MTIAGVVESDDRQPSPDDPLVAAHEQIHNLEIALASARRIGTAVGIIMATYKVTDEAAFDLLVVASQNSHRKLRDVAEHVVDTGDLNWHDMKR